MKLANTTIDGRRLLADLYRLREFGTYKTGVHRPTYSDIDMQSRHWLCDQMRDAGLDPEIDGIGNVIGRSPGQGPRLLLGSHIETQNHAGWLDGALGVMYGLEIARHRNEHGLGGVDVAAWADEEGHYGSFLGSRSFVGDVSDEDMDGARNRYTDMTLREALQSAGLAGIAPARLEPGRYRGYIEAHIEQGDALEAAGLRIGVVTSIVGIWQYKINFEGVQNHAGTTRMAIRKDAGVALVKLCGEVERRFPAVAGPRSVWTVGRITLTPGAASIVPGGGEMMLQFRDAEPEILTRMEAELTAIVAEADTGPCRVTLSTLSRSIPKVMDEGFRAALTRAADRLSPGAYQSMPSGAGHDAQQLARQIPSAMLFVPSIGGISHHWSENTEDADIVLGCEVMAAAVDEILAE